MSVRALVRRLQVSFRTTAQRQGFTVEVCVIDKNDNVPTFIGESMRGSVQLGLLKGEQNRPHFPLVREPLLSECCLNNGEHFSFSPWKLQSTLEIRVESTPNIAHSQASKRPN